MWLTGSATERGGSVHHDVQSAKTLQQAGTDRFDLITLDQVERQKRRLPAGGADRVVGSSRPPWVRATRIGRAPSRASSIATAAPMPRLAR